MLEPVTPCRTAGDVGLLAGLPGDPVWGLVTVTADMDKVVGTCTGLVPDWVRKGTETTACSFKQQHIWIMLNKGRNVRSSHAGFGVPVRCPWPPQTQASGSGVGSGAPEWPAGLQPKAPEQAEWKRPAPEGGSWQPGGSRSEPCAGTELAGRLEDKPDLWVRWFRAEAGTGGTQEELYKNKKVFSLDGRDENKGFSGCMALTPGWFWLHPGLRSSWGWWLCRVAGTWVYQVCSGWEL